MLDSFGSIKHFKLDTLEQNRNILEFSMTLLNDLRLIHLQRQKLWSFKYPVKIMSFQIFMHPQKV